MLTEILVVAGLPLLIAGFQLMMVWSEVSYDYRQWRERRRAADG